MNCYWCDVPPPCAHRSVRNEEEGLDRLRQLTQIEQLKIRWVRWFHAPADPDHTWCNCGRRYPCQTRLDVIG